MAFDFTRGFISLEIIERHALVGDLEFAIGSFDRAQKRTVDVAGDFHLLASLNEKRGPGFGTLVFTLTLCNSVHFEYVQTQARGVSQVFPLRPSCS